ncbi:GIY-YIG nuclease family protein [Pseudomonas sp. S1(2024)]|uniref:GIY-YIG nuclease family protein n=1 Tax=Pseudomonas sp. S1(2024) TaxID=3390191 RepID=UPI00397DEC23
MNKFVKMAINKIHENDINYDFLYRTKQYASVVKRQGWRKGDKRRVDNALCHALKYNFEFSTISGPKSFPTDLASDKLAITTFWVPVGEFFYCPDYKSYRCGFVEATDKFGNVQKAIDLARSETFKAWQKAKRFLLQKKGKSLVRPLFCIGNSSTYVYFFRDLNNKQIKIGFSGDPVARMIEISRQHGRGDIFLEHAIPDHGRDLEQKLHKHFHQFACGYEWFKENRELDCLIKNLQSGHAIQDLLPMQ